MNDNRYSCIICGRDGMRWEDGCGCRDSRQVIETWRDSEDGVTYEVTYPHECDPVQVGAHGNLSRAIDTLVGRRWADTGEAV